MPATKEKKTSSRTARKRAPKRLPKPTVAAQLFTLREHLKTPADMRRSFKRLRKIGYEAAQISGVGPIDPAELRTMMLDCGVKPIGAHVALAIFRADIGKVIADCQAWGVQYVAIPSLPADAATTPAAWRKLAREFARYGKKLAEEGIKLQYHNHAFEFQKFGMKGGHGGQTGLEILFDASEPEYLQSELDLGWVMRGNQNPVAWARKLNGRLDQVHLKDWGIHQNEPVWRAIGEGSSRWAEIISACRHSGTAYFLVEQDACPVTNNPFASLRISYEYLKALKIAR